MADGRPQLNDSVLIDDYFALSETLPNQNVLIASTPSTKANLTYKGNEFAWNGCLESLKCFVQTDLNLRGKWSSPGGEVKLFKDSEVSIKWYGKNKKLLIVQDDAKQSLTNKLKILASVVYEKDKYQGNDAVKEANVSNVVTANLLKGKSEYITYEGDDKQSDKIESNITGSNCKIESNSICYCSELAVQVKRIENDIKLLKGQIDNNMSCCNINACHMEKNRLRHDLVQANVLIKDLQERISILQNVKSGKFVTQTNTHEASEIDANDSIASGEINNHKGISQNNNTINMLAQSTISNDLPVDKTFVCEDIEQHISTSTVAEPIVESHHGTYAQAVKLLPKNSKSNRQSSDKSKRSLLHQPPNESAVYDGFIGVNRKRNRIKKFFVSGIHESVNEGQIRSYLEHKKVIPTYISLFRSRRKGTCSAKVHIPSSMCALVQTDGFWPKYVKCSSWKTKNLTEKNPNITRNGNLSTRV